jgi:Reverse transcriptase (RNA-dependent DNA polymerase)
VYQAKKNGAGEIDKYRAQLVAQGYSQIPSIDYDDTFAPIVKMSSIRVVLLFAACHGWPAHQMDVKSIYLNGKLDDSEDLYLQQPPGYAIPGSEHLVL